MNQGILIIGMGGPKYVRECKACIRACLHYSKGKLPITVVTDRPQDFAGKSTIMTHPSGQPMVNPPGTLQVIGPVADRRGFKNQTGYMTASAYDRTLHLDCDAIPVHSTAFQPFLMLDRFDFVAAHAAARGFKTYNPNCPPCFPQFNCGVMFFTKEAFPVFRAWDNGFNPRNPGTNPQLTLAAMLYRTELRLGTLPPEWNYRGTIAFPIGTQMRIAHSHHAPPMVKADGSIDQERLQRWFNSPIIRKGLYHAKEA